MPKKLLSIDYFIFYIFIITAFMLYLHEYFIGIVGTYVAVFITWLWLLYVVMYFILFIKKKYRKFIFCLIFFIFWFLSIGKVLVPLDYINYINSVNYSSSKKISIISYNVKEGSNSIEKAFSEFRKYESDLIFFVELSNKDKQKAEYLFKEEYPEFFSVGTIALWSKYEINNPKRLDLGLGWNRAMHVDINYYDSNISFYGIHADSISEFNTIKRDVMINNLTELIKRDESGRIISAGDYNAPTFDPVFKNIKKFMYEPNQSDSSFGYTWNNIFSFARIDHIFIKGMVPLENRTIKIASSDHKALFSRFIIK